MNRFPNEAELSRKFNSADVGPGGEEHGDEGSYCLSGGSEPKEASVVSL